MWKARGNAFVRPPLSEGVTQALLLLLTGIVAPASGTAAVAEPSGAGLWVHYRCAAAKEFSVSRTAAAATVRSVAGTLRLIRGRSSIGQRYGSPAATLILDGEFASLVWKGAERFRDCRMAPPHAAAG